MNRFVTAAGTVLAFGAASVAPAFAHAGPEGHGSFLAGLGHPVSGVDHLVAMVAVGVFASVLGGRARLAVPGAFVGAMVAGFGMALAGVSLPLVEPAILASLVVIGLMLAATARLPLALSAGIVGAFGLFHGFAHGGEMGSASALAYGAGFVLATLGLHGAGLLAGNAVAARSGTLLPRLVGAGTALTGVALMVG
ncbi:HupE/UreJ family protein [Aurantimonas sp. Leaf443]|uniref:HupE/UreJ family protein n=1 Tax=Aurantimonas sp. Leaf443 TaxID=1736378 RepID=UPI0006F5C752|nr:HupE/UreJ family protein [Aurantimonas sp. Leaf443]KQT86167.1 protein hupE [Aurantimonas sp. Leaf443]